MRHIASHQHLYLHVVTERVQKTEVVDKWYPLDGCGCHSDLAFDEHMAHAECHSPGSSTVAATLRACAIRCGGMVSNQLIVVPKEHYLTFWIIGSIPCFPTLR